MRSNGAHCTRMAFVTRSRSLACRYPTEVMRAMGPDFWPRGTRFAPHMRRDELKDAPHRIAGGWELQAVPPALLDSLGSDPAAYGAQQAPGLRGRIVERTRLIVVSGEAADCDVLCHTCFEQLLNFRGSSPYVARALDHPLSTSRTS